MKKLLLTLLSFIAISGSALAEERQISVQGNWSKSAADDRAAITFTVSLTDKDVAKVERETHRTYSQLLKAIEVLKFKDQKLESTQYSLNPEYSWDKGKKIYLGHKASIGLNLTTSEIKRIGEAIVAAKRVGVDEIGSLTTYLSEEAREKLYLQGLELAMKDAAHKADLLLKAANAKRGKIISIVEAKNTMPSFPMPRPMMAMAKSFRAMEADQAPAPEVQAGESSVSVIIAAIYAIE